MPINATRNIATGANSSRRQVYVDRHIPKRYRKYLAIHERKEGENMDKGYDRAHRIATEAERNAVEADGLDWKRYTRELAGYLARIEHEPDETPAGVHVSPKVALGRASGGRTKRRADRR